MPRALSQAARRAVYAAQTGEVFVLLLTLSHADLPEVIRVSSDYPGTMHGGESYQHFPFRLELPGESDEAPGGVRLQIDNVDRRIVEAVRSVDGGELDLTVKVVLASSPDTVECGPYEFVMRDIRYDALVVEGDLVLDDDVLNEPYPAESVTPATMPGVFKG